MDFIKENLNTPVADEYDILVVGGGPAGCGAALGAAKVGAKVAIVERFNCLGGAWTTGFMNPMFDFSNKKGVIQDIVGELKEKEQFGGFWNISFNYEYMKRLLDVKMTDAGVKMYLNTRFSKTIVENKKVSGVICENEDGRFALKTKTVIDCTGDGNACSSAGCEYLLGDVEGIKDCQAMTLMFLVGNIPDKHKDGLMIGPYLDEAYKKEGKEAPFHFPFLIPIPGSHFGVVQFTHMYEHDPLSNADVTAATIEGRQQMIEGFELLKKHCEDFKDLELIFSSSVLGIRESRRIIGDYIISDEDVINGIMFDDGICIATCCSDIHPKGNRAQDCRKTQPYEIPWRAMIPKGFDGLAVAGRCISGSHVAMASYRVTGNCCAMGEGAGILTAYAIKNNLDIRKLNVKQIISEYMK